MMKNLLHRSIVAALSAMTLLIGGRASAQDRLACGDQSVTYSSFDETFSSKITVEPRPASRGVLDVSEKQFSPYKTGWITVNVPDYKNPGPWNTQVFIYDTKASSAEVLTFKDHGSGGVRLSWLNEKLLTGSVWWGRIVSTDFIFDVEKKTFIYREMANYGEMVQPCQ
jgi:hypothetical protein